MANDIAHHGGVNALPSHQQLRKEYRVWRLNAPFLYDIVSAHALRWPSYTVEWLSGKKSMPSSDTGQQAVYNMCQMISGSTTQSQEPSELILLDVLIPIAFDLGVREVESDENTATSIETSINIKTAKRFATSDDVVKTRVMPHLTRFVAALSRSGHVEIFDLCSASDEVEKSSDVSTPRLSTPNVLLNGLHKEGTGIAWSSTLKGNLVASSTDVIICQWDLYSNETNDGGTEPLRTYTNGHTQSVRAVDWCIDGVCFASVGDAGLLCLWDTRAPDTTINRVMAHTGAATSVQWNPFDAAMLATGSSDHSVQIWDIRTLKSPVSKLQHSQHDVSHVSWAPFQRNVLASCGRNRRVYVWNIDDIGKTQSDEDARDGPPELMFIHGGHSAPVAECSWSKDLPWMMASTAGDSIVQVWEMASCLRPSTHA